MKNDAMSLLVAYSMVTVSFFGALPVFAMESGPTPDPPDHLWMYIEDDIDGDGLLEKIYFLSRDEFLFGSVFENIPPSIPYDDTPGSFAGDNVGIRSPGYQVISESGGISDILLDYGRVDETYSAVFVSDTGGTMVTIWEDNDVRLTRTAELTSERLLLTFTVENLGTETMEDMTFVEKHRFDDSQVVFNEDKYKGGQLLGIDHPGLHDMPLMGMVYNPVPDSITIDDSLAFDPSTATFVLGDLDAGEEVDVQLAVVWSTESNPDDALDQVVDRMVNQKIELRTIEATIEIHPETLNLKSKGKWVSCIIELPDYLDESDIDPNTVRLEGTIAAEKPVVTGTSLNVKFDRSELAALLTAGKDIVLTVTGKLWDGMPFEGTDTIDAIHR
ncbi:MAG: hypothetical protein V3U51_03025 [Thermoplasmata archaeon]